MQQIEELTKAVVDLQDEAVKLTTTVTSHTSVFRRWRVIATSLLVLGVALGGVSVWQLNMQVTTVRKVAEDQRQMCPLVTLLIPQPGDPAPATARGRQVAEAARQLAVAIHCPTTGA